MFCFFGVISGKDRRVVPMSTINVALVDGGESFRRYLEPTLKTLFHPKRVTFNKTQPAQFVFFSFDQKSRTERFRVPGNPRIIMINGEPNDSRSVPRVSAVIDCKRTPGNVYLPFYVSSFAERYRNVPTDLVKTRIDPEKILGSKKKFCAFLYWNVRPVHRAQAFKAFNEYKPVDALGKSQSKKSDSQVDRRHYQVGHSTYNDLAVEKYRPYKFVLCLENSLGKSGYVTEKIVSAMLANAIPIYWGAPDVSKHFNPKSFINIADFKSLKDAVKYVSEIDRDDAKWKAMIQEPWLPGNKLNEYFRPGCISGILGARALVPQPSAVTTQTLMKRRLIRLGGPSSKRRMIITR